MLSVGGGFSYLLILSSPSCFWHDLNRTRKRGTLLQHKRKALGSEDHVERQTRASDGKRREAAADCLSFPSVEAGQLWREAGRPTPVKGGKSPSPKDIVLQSQTRLAWERGPGTCGSWDKEPCPSCIAAPRGEGSARKGVDALSLFRSVITTNRYL